MSHFPAAFSPVTLRRLLLGTSALLPAAFCGVAQAQAPNAVPTGGQVTAGQASISQSGTRTQVTQSSNRAVVDWQTFNVGRNASVNFTQPSAQSWTLNRVATPDPSLIAGRITANGGVAIVNPSGVVFTPGSQVNVGSLIATTSNISNQNFMAGRMVFDGAPRPGARVENHGSITVADRGLAALVAPGVANSGTIRARLGTAVMAGAETFRLDLAGDGMLSIDVTQSVRRAPDGAVALVTNSGVVEAQGGQVILTANAASGLVESVVRNTGRVAANGANGRVSVSGTGGAVDIAAGSVTARGGAVTVAASGGTVNVGREARVSSSSRRGRGGTVQLGGADTGAVTVAGRVSARGAGANSTGGTVRVQAQQSVALAGTAVVDASGQAGGGTVLVGTTGVGRVQTMARETRVEAGATVRADAITRGNGGTVVVNSAESTVMAGNLSARGGAASGDGGFIEISGMQGLRLRLAGVDVSAPAGRGGEVLLDPTSITIASSGENADLAEDFPSGTVGSGSPPASLVLLASDVNSFNSGGLLTLQATEAIIVNAAVNRTGSLTLETGASGSGISINAALTTSGALILNSGTAITVDAGVSGSAVTMTAAGNITVNQAVSASAGDITLTSTGGAISQGASGTLTVANQTISLTADSMNLGAALSAGAGTVVLAPTSGTALIVGSSGTGLVLDPTALGGVSAANLQLGNASTGAVTVAEAFASPSANLTLVGSSIAVNAALDGVAGGTVRLAAETAITATADITVGNVATPGAILLQPRDGRAISVGGTEAGALIIDTAVFPHLLAEQVVVGGTGLSYVGQASYDTSNITLRGALNIGTWRDLALRAQGNVLQDSDAALVTARSVSGHAVAGSFRLGADTDDAQWSNNIGAIGTVAGTGVIGTEGITAGLDIRVDSTAEPLSVLRTVASTGDDRTITLISDQMLPGTIQAPGSGGTVVLRPFTEGRALIVGTAGTGTELVLDPTALGGISAANLQLGGSTTGTVTVASAFTSPATNLTLVGSSIAVNAALDGVAGGTVRLAAETAITATADITVGNVATPGAILLQPRDGRAISVGGAEAGALIIDTAVFPHLLAEQVVVGGTGLSYVGQAYYDTTDVTLRGALNIGTWRDLALRAQGNVLQDSDAALVTARSVSGHAVEGHFWLGADTDDAQWSNNIGAIGTVAGTGVIGTEGITASLDIRVDSAAEPLSVRRQVRSSGLGQTVTLVADDLDIHTTDGLISAPEGTIALRPFTNDRNVSLGGDDVAGTLSLSTAELARFGVADPDMANVLRIGLADPGLNTVGDITINGTVGLRSGVIGLELFAGAQGTTTGSITTASGGLDVSALSGMSRLGADFGTANSIDQLRPIQASYTIGVPFNDPAIAGLTLENLSFWAGTGAAQAGGPATGGSFRLGSTTGLAVSGGILSSGTAGGVELRTSTGNITLDSHRWIAAENGAVTVTAAGTLTNNGSIVSANPSGSTVSGASVVNAGAILAGSVSGLSVNSGTIVATTVSGPLSSNSGSISAASSATSSTSLANSGTIATGQLSVSGTLTNGGTIQSPSVTATEVVNQPAGTIAAGTAGTASAGTGLRRNAILGLGTQLAMPSPLSSGDLLVRSTGTDIVNQGTISASAGSVTLEAAQDLRQSGTISTLEVLAITAGRDALQTGGTTTAGSLGTAAQGVSAGRDFLWNGGSVTLPTIHAMNAGRDLALGITSGSATLLGGLTAGRDLRVVTSAGSLTLQSVTLSAQTGALALEAAGDLTMTGSALSSSLGMTLRSGGAMTIGASEITGDAIDLAAGSGLDFTQAKLTAQELTATAGGDVTVQGSTLSSSQDMTLRSGGAMIIGSSEIAGHAISLAAGAGLALTQGTLTAQDLTATAGGDVAVQGSTLSSSQSMALRSGGAMSIGSSGFTANAVSLAAGSSLAFTQSTLTAQDLTGSAGSGVTVQGSTLRASTSPAASAAAFHTLRLSAGGSLVLRDSAIFADRAEFVAGGRISMSGTPFQIGTGLLFSARGGVAQPGGTTSVRPIDPARLPLVIFDTRSGTFLSSLPTALNSTNADRPGTEFNQQVWQVPGTTATAGQLLFGVNDGAPAAPRSTAGGAVVLDMNVGSAPVFLLLNGGTASGTLNAGRLGVYGLPGEQLAGGRSVDLTGQLGGVGGEAAARFGVLGDVPGGSSSASDQQAYRFNNCVLSSVNCVVPTTLQLPLLPITNSITLATPRADNDERDVVLPNVAEKDY